MRRFRFPVLAALSLCLIGLGSLTPCHGDTLVLKNGQRHEGRLISADDRLVVFEIQDVGVRMTLRRAARDVQQVIRESKDGPTYCILPIVGVIGRDEQAALYVTAEAFRQVLAEVRSAKPDFVVLMFKSPGGDIAVMNELVTAIEEAKELKFIAYVDEAYSAAAVIAMTCPRIFMAPKGNIGAAVPFQLGPEGTPQNIQEKHLSAILASFRSAARIGGHSPLIVRGMSETDIELAVVERDGKSVVIEAHEDDTARVIKRKGRILTLTADEALACGLSLGTVEDNQGIRQHLGIDSWRLTLAHVSEYMADKSRSEMRQLAVAREAAAREAARKEQIQLVFASVGEIDTELEAVQARKAAAQQTEVELVAQWNNEYATAYANYQYAFNQAANTSNPAYWQNKASNQYNQDCATITARLQPQLTATRNTIREMTNLETQLADRRRRLMGTLDRTR